MKTSRIASFITAISLFVSGFTVFVLPNQVNAQSAGQNTGGGTQSTRITRAALEGLELSTNLEQVQTYLDLFSSQYNINIRLECPSNPQFTCVTPTNSNFVDAKNMASIIISQWSKYPVTYLNGTSVDGAYLVKDLMIGESGVAGLVGTINQPLFNINFSTSNRDYMARNVHHEFHHVVNRDLNPTVDAVWESHNPPGFVYQPAPLGSTDPTEHADQGFVQGYSKTSMAEDKAMTYQYLFFAEDYAKITGWIATDQYLAAKVNDLKGDMASLDSSINNDYFNTITTYDPTIAVAPSTSSISDANTNLLLILKNETLVVDGARGETRVLPGGTLKGGGNVGLLSVLGGTVAPGQSPGCLNAGNTTFNSSSTLQVEIAGINGTCPGLEYDRLVITGTLSLGDAVLDTTFLNNFIPSIGNKFTIIENDLADNVTGIFAGLTQGAKFTKNGVEFEISYIGGDGNDVVLTVINAPVVAPIIPATPNTGMKLLLANPLVTIASSITTAGALFVIARKYNLFTK